MPGSPGRSERLHQIREGEYRQGEMTNREGTSRGAQAGHQIARTLDGCLPRELLNRTNHRPQAIADHPTRSEERPGSGLRCYESRDHLNERPEDPEREESPDANSFEIGRAHV